MTSSLSFMIDYKYNTTYLKWCVVLTSDVNSTSMQPKIAYWVRNVWINFWEFKSNIQLSSKTPLSIFSWNRKKYLFTSAKYTVEEIYFRLVLNQSENGNYNLNLVLFNKIQDWFLRMHMLKMMMISLNSLARWKEGEEEPINMKKIRILLWYCIYVSIVDAW